MAEYKNKGQVGDSPGPEFSGRRRINLVHELSSQPAFVKHPLMRAVSAVRGGKSQNEQNMGSNWQGLYRLVRETDIYLIIQGPSE